MIVVEWVAQKITSQIMCLEIARIVHQTVKYVQTEIRVLLVSPITIREVESVHLHLLIIMQFLQQTTMNIYLVPHSVKHVLPH